MSMLARSEPRDGYVVRVLAVHTTEGGGTAAALRDADWWTGSSHAIADEATLLTPAEGCVPYELASWTLRSGNRWSENIELVGYASYTRTQWLARPGLLRNCARWLAARSKARGVPLVKITADQYRAGGWGVIGHVDHTEGYQDGSHWDPGPNFPYDVVLPMARTIAEGQDPEGDDMDAEQARQLRYIYDHMTPGTAGVKRHGKGFEALIAGSLTSGKEGEWSASWGYRTLAALQTQVTALTVAFDKVADGTTNGEELKAAMREVMADVIRVEVSVENPDGTPA